MKVSVIGTGYVGLVTGTCLAETGNEVVCVDIDEKKVQKMQDGIVPIYEPHLDVLFDRNIKAKRLKFTTSLDKGLDHGDIVFLALPTPEDEDGSADLKYVLGVAEDIGKLIKDYKVIVDKSTVPVGTSEKVHEAERQQDGGIDDARRALPRRPHQRLLDRYDVEVTQETQHDDREREQDVVGALRQHPDRRIVVVVVRCTRRTA